MSCENKNWSISRILRLDFDFPAFGRIVSQMTLTFTGSEEGDNAETLAAIDIIDNIGSAKQSA